MAGEVVLSSNNNKEYPGKLTLRVFLTCIVAATGGLIFGYDHGVSGGVTSMNSFLKEFFPAVYEKQSTVKPSDDQYCKFESQILTLFTSSLYISALFASIVAAKITRMLGRRTTMLLSGILFICGSTLNGLAKWVWMLIVGRLLLGVGIGFANQSVPIYLSEVAPYRYRGALNMMFQLSITIGIFVANFVNYSVAQIKDGQGWRYSLGGGAVPAFMILVGSIILPDTPNSLIERGREKEAREQLIKIRGTTDVDQELNDLVAASKASKLVKHPWRTLLERKYKPQITMAIAIPFFQQLTGLNVITFYAPVLFRTIGFGSNASLMSATIIGACKPVATLFSILIVDKLGRRSLFLIGGSVMLICQTVIAIAIGLKFGTSGKPEGLPQWYASTVVLFICIYVIGFAVSWGPLGWLVPSEIFPLEIRSAAQSINVSVNMISTFIIAQLFTDMLCHMKFGLFIFFGFFVVVMSVFIYKLLPETKGIPIEEMSVVWQNHPYWRKFVNPQNTEVPQTYKEDPNANC